MALADFNRDGFSDAVVVNSGQASKVYFNDGTGRFVDSGQNLGSGNFDGRGVALGFIDADFTMDAFIVNGSGQPNRVYFNDGSGTLIDSGQNLGTLNGQGVALAFLNADFILDAFLINSGQPNQVLFNDGIGTFSDSGQNLGTFDSQGVALADIDGDGDTDAFVANGSGQPNRVYFNDGDGTFTDSGQNLGTFDSRRVALRDLDDDNDLDAFVVNSGQPNQVYFNNGTGTFTDSGQRLGSFGGRDVDLADVDGDSDIDAFVANNNGLPGQGNKVWLNDGSGRFVDSGQELGASVAVELHELIPLAEVDSATFPWMTEDDDPFRPGNQGLSVGVTHAWEYLRYHDLPPSEGVYDPPIVAIVDSGFALDPTTGVPLNGNLDYNNSFSAPREI